MNYLVSYLAEPQRDSNTRVPQDVRIGMPTRTILLVVDVHQSETDGERPALRGLVDHHLEEWFRRYAHAWKVETAGLSSINQKVQHPAFRAIISMDPQSVLPLILRDLETEPYHWFPALKRLSGGEDPVPPQHRGNVPEMRRAWLDWGRRQGLLT